ncbi:hypothetical protein MKX01_015093 [Papaver californicum]|nr:hypothetical protein MKX01_015093 [Papaver californicum]
MSLASSNNNCSSNSCTVDEELNEQLRTQLSLVPNVTQTDPISILEQTRDYLRRIHEETERLEKKWQVGTDNTGGKREFVVKILWKRLGQGAAAEVQRAIEFCDLNVKMNSTVVSSFINPDELQTTAFVKVKNERNMMEKEPCDLLGFNLRK